MVVLGHGVCDVTQNGRHVVKDETLPVRKDGNGHEHEPLPVGVAMEMVVLMKCG